MEPPFLICISKDGETWFGAVHGIAKTWTRLSDGTAKIYILYLGSTNYKHSFMTYALFIFTGFGKEEVKWKGSSYLELKISPVQSLFNLG